ncbi:CIC11C00000000116 [Sungouiella intermedia]|uniref:CIC11C00000000116 n=1 Tax=Sungouiella intermedia TaxID=45354 RepID=A0A1L0C1P1_9ASCO|nr:CIC11C00000000116 [[Candida] intermedia]
MVSFSCEVCNDTVIKKKLDQHSQRCHGAYFTCIDCSTTFSGTDYRGHTQCISEAEKYEKALYKGKKKPAKEEKKFVKEEKKDVKEVKQEKKPVKEEKKEKSKISKQKKEKKIDLSKYSNGSLYKIIKDMSKDLNKDKKDVLKQLQVAVEDGKFVVSL